MPLQTDAKRTLVLTRPLATSRETQTGLRAHQVPTVILPALSIRPISMSQRRLAWQELLAFAPTLIIFISPSAVRCMAPLLEAQWPGDALQVTGIGPGTVAALLQVQVSAHGGATPSPVIDHYSQDAQSLWQQLAAQGQVGHGRERVAIVRGEAGTRFLDGQLHALGAAVHICEVYQRQPARWSAAMERKWLGLRCVAPTPAWLITSTASYEVLCKRHRERGAFDWFEQCPQLAAHTRILQHISLGAPAGASRLLCDGLAPAQIADAMARLTRSDS